MTRELRSRSWKITLRDGTMTIVHPSHGDSTQALAMYVEMLNHDTFSAVEAIVHDFSRMVRWDDLYIAAFRAFERVRADTLRSVQYYGAIQELRAAIEQANPVAVLRWQSVDAPEDSLAAEAVRDPG